MAVRERLSTSYELHRDYVLAVLGQRCGWLDRSDREALFHDACLVMLEKQAEGELDLEGMHDREVRAYLTQTSLFKGMAEGRRAEHRLTTELDAQAAARPDPGSGPEERVEAVMSNAPVREIVAELPTRQQAIVKLRFYFDRAPAEIQRVLGITERTYRRQLERGMRRIAERYELVRAGRWCEDRHDLLISFVAGTAEPADVQLARAHIESCPGCARMVGRLRTATRTAAAALPLPALPEAEAPFARLAEAAIAVRDRAAELVAGVADRVAVSVGRIDLIPAHYAAGVRPGALAGSLAACVVIGGGTTYCAVEGFPEPLRSVFAGEPSALARSSAPPSRALEPRIYPAPTPDELIPPNPRVRERQQGPANEPSNRGERDNREADAAPPPAPAPPESSPAPAPGSEFSPEAPIAPPAPSPGPGSAQGPPGEFDL